jgi:CRP/FNR family transcriptional regulator, anaerobic regulatory protein
MFENLFNCFERILKFDENEKAIIQHSFRYLKVPKKKRLTESGKIAKEIYFVNKGLLRLYYTKGESEFTGFIFKENLFAGSYESFLTQAPGIQSLETLEECELLSINYNQLQQLYQQVPKVNIIARVVADHRFINGQKILSSFILDSPEERYLKFIETQGDLLLRVPNNIIASYLGITPVSLSRIRKRLLK